MHSGHSNGEGAFLRWAVDCLRREAGETRKILSEFEGRLRAVESRWSLLALIVALKDLALALKALAKAVAPVKEWLIGLVLVVLALKGILSPDDVRDVLRSHFGLR